VRSLTPKAEAFLSEDTCLSLRRGQLVLADIRETRQLQDAIRRAAQDPEPGGPVAATHRLLLHDRNYLPFVVELLPVPKKAHLLAGARPVRVVLRSNSHCVIIRLYMH